LPVEDERGTLLPTARATAVLKRLLILDTYPSRCQARIDAWVGAYGICATALEGARDVAGTEAAVVDAPGWSLGDMITAGAISLAVGLVVGGGIVLGVSR